MNPVSLNDHQSSQYLKLLAVSEAKVGKTCTLVAQALGVFPGQKYGGIVDRPENLHVLALDSGAVTGVKNFLTQSCKAPVEALGVNIWPFENEVAQLSQQKDGWSWALHNNIMQVRQRIGERAAKGGTHALIISSLSTLAQGIKRSISGDPAAAGKRGAGMDMAKWDAYSNQLSELRWSLQSGNWHTIWEGHVTAGPPKDDKDEDSPKKETLSVQGKAGSYFSQNVEQILRIKRMYGERIGDSKVDKVVFDTQPTLEFIASGRAFTEMLEPRETDLTLVCHKLGLKIGRWGARGKAA